MKASILSSERREEWNRKPQFRCVVDADLLTRAYRCVPKEETRYCLNGVNVSRHPDGGAMLVAADGHILGVPLVMKATGGGE